MPERKIAAVLLRGDFACRSVIMRTYGFDYVFAVSVESVNKTLTKNLSDLTSVVYKTVDEDSGSTISLNARLAAWSIVAGGQNNLLNMSLPISSGSLTLAGGALKGDYKLDGVAAIMQISLGWIGTGTGQDATGSGTSTNLVFSPDGTKDKNNPGYVATLQILDPNKRLDSLASGLLRQYMADVLVSNKDKLKYIFANVNPVAAGVGSWLKARKWLYYYAEAGNLRALCFLCMLSEAAFPQSAFDSGALSSGTNSLVLVSQPRFFENVALPAVRSAFPSGSFQVKCQDDVCSVINAGSFSFGNVTTTSLTVATSSDGNGLAVSAGGGGPLKFLFGLVDLPNASYSWSLKSTNPLDFDGRQVAFKKDPNPQMAHDQTIPWYDWVLLVVVGITNLPGLISAILALVTTFSDQVQNAGMDFINSHVQSSTGGAIVNLASLMDWRGGGLTITAAGLSGALYVRGNLG